VRGTVLGPWIYNGYSENVVSVTEQHSVTPHLYADDSQLHASFKPEDISKVRQRLCDCIADVAQWCASRRLQLNPDNTEAVWIGSRASISKLASQDRSLVVDAETISLTDVVRI